MGYTHYWRREKTIAVDIFKAIRQDFEKLLLPLHDAGVKLGDGSGANVPVIEDEGIVFNGLSACGHPQNSEITLTWPTAEAGGVGSNRKAEDGHWYAGVSLDTRCCDGDCSYETFAFLRDMDGGYPDENGLHFDCTKTAFRPYDIAVTAFLIIAKNHMGCDIRVTSDGEDAHWFDAKMLCLNVLGYGPEFEMTDSGLVNTARPDAERKKPTPTPTKEFKPVRTIPIDECTKMIRKALKQGFPRTTFSVRKTRSTYSFNIDVRWTDGPTAAQVKPILDRYESKGFDGMTDCSYSCGNRVLNGEPVEVCGNYVRGSRSTSQAIRKLVVDKLALECGLSGITYDQYGNIKGAEQVVPFQWHKSWHEGPLSVEEFQATKHFLASDSHSGEWFTTLVNRIEHCISTEAQSPISADLLPEYIDVNATVSTGRAEFEPKQPMFEGHAAFQTEQAAIESFETEPAKPSVPSEFHCSIGRTFARPSGWVN